MKLSCSSFVAILSVLFFLTGCGGPDPKSVAKGFWDAYKKGEYEKWIKLWDEKVGNFGHWNKQGREAVLKTFGESGHIAAIEEMFRMNEKYGNDCYMDGGVKTERYIKLGNNDKAMEALEKGYEIRGVDMPYISPRFSYYEQLKDNPRYVEILRKMNLPLANN